MNPREFEIIPAKVLSEHYGIPLSKRKIADHPKEFDFVSQDCSVIGDAKFYSLVRGKSNPPAKWSIISEHVWLLEKVPARERFLVFGNDRRVPTSWLKRWGHLLGDHVKFFFLAENGDLERLHPS